jgi:hypothetical protein
MVNYKPGVDFIGPAFFKYTFKADADPFKGNGATTEAATVSITVSEIIAEASSSPLFGFQNNAVSNLTQGTLLRLTGNSSSIPDLSSLLETVTNPSFFQNKSTRAIESILNP